MKLVRGDWGVIYTTCSSKVIEEGFVFDKGRVDPK